MLWLVFIISSSITFHGRSATLDNPVLALSPKYWLNGRASRFLSSAKPLQCHDVDRSDEACAEMVKRSQVGGQDAVAGEVKNGLFVAIRHLLTAIRASLAAPLR